MLATVKKHNTLQDLTALGTVRFSGWENQNNFTQGWRVEFRPLVRTEDLDTCLEPKSSNHKNRCPLLVSGGGKASENDTRVR